MIDIVFRVWCRQIIFIINIHIQNVILKMSARYKSNTEK